MSRRANAKPAGIQMFPFLAVLICTMGALVVLLHAFARHGQLQAIEVAKTAVKAPQVEVEDFEWRNEHIRAARAKTQAQLAEERLKLAHVEDHTRRLAEKLDQLKRAAEEIARAGTETDDQTQQRAAELEATKEELDKARAALEKARRAGGNKPVNYSVVPYDGVHATRRRPIYIECRENSIVLQPEGVELSPRDFAGYFGPSNPLAAAVRAQREYFAGKAPDGDLALEPYPLLLVRPEGIMTYNAARQALVSWGSDFGYELIGADWEIKFRDPDPKLAELMNSVVGEARLRHREYTLTSPHVARRRSRPVYHAKAHGGFAPEGGGSYSPRGVGNSPWEGSGGDWSGGADPDSGGDPYASSEGRDGFSAGGDAASRDPYGAHEGGDGLAHAGNGKSANPYRSSEGRDGFESTGSPNSQAPYGSSDVRRDGRAPGGNSKAQAPYGSSPGRESRSSGGNAASGDPYGESQGNSADGQQKGSPGSEANGSDSDYEGAPGATQNDGQPRPGGNSGGSANAPGGQNAGDAADCDCPGGAPSETESHSFSASHGSNKKPQSMATHRGSDWGLPSSGGRSVAATRPIRVLCYSGQLVIMPDSQGQLPKKIPLQADTQDSMDELVSSVWEHMKSWGKAGSRLYWRPLLSIDIQPGGQTRYTDIEALLADSGIDVQRRQPQPAPRNNSRPALRQPFRQ